MKYACALGLFLTFLNMSCSSSENSQSEKPGSEKQSEELTETKAKERISNKPKGVILDQFTIDEQVAGIGRVEAYITSVEQGLKIEITMTIEGDSTFQLPFVGNDWVVEEISSFSLLDLNGDANEDLVLVASCMTGIGAQGAQSFPVVAIYMNESGAFSYDEELSNSLAKNNLFEPESIAQFLKSK